jgi:hypothetical protein
VKLGTSVNTGKFRQVSRLAPVHSLVRQHQEEIEDRDRQRNPPAKPPPIKTILFGEDGDNGKLGASGR